MSNIIATTTLVAALFIAGLNTAAASGSAFEGVLSQPAVITGLTTEQRALSTKGIQYRPGPSSSNTYRVYQLNDSKKSHRPEKVKNPYCSDEVSQPNRSRKQGSGSGVV